MTEDVANDWLEAYASGYRQMGAALMAIRRRRERREMSFKSLVQAAELVASRAATAVAAPSTEHAIALGQIAGATSAVRWITDQGRVNVNFSASPEFRRQMTAWAGERIAKLAPGLMAASDGQPQTLLLIGAASELRANADVHIGADGGSLINPADLILNAASGLADLNWSARPRPTEEVRARAEALGQAITQQGPVLAGDGDRSAHAHGVHYLTKIYGSGEASLRQVMLRFIASYPTHDRATLQAARVAALLSDKSVPDAKMALLDQILISLGPSDGDWPTARPRARDTALVLLLLDDDAAASNSSIATPRPLTAARSSAEHHETSGGARPEPAPPIAAAAWITELFKDSRQVTKAASASRMRRFKRAVKTGSITDAIAVAREAAADDDHDQTTALLRELAKQELTADASQLVTIAPNILGTIELDSDQHFDDPEAGLFTVLTPEPAKAAVALTPILGRLLTVDDQGTEHANNEITSRYTPNTVDHLRWSTHAVQISLDTKGSMSAPMARGMLRIITDALVQDRVPAVITGYVPALEDQMAPWTGGR